MIKALLVYIFLFSSLMGNALQDAINKASPFSTIKLSSGIYIGNIIIKKPLTIVGTTSDVVIQGSGQGTVISIESSFVHLKNITIENSGNRMENIDAAIRLQKVKHCEITSCKIINSLYGIDMMMVSDSLISHNYITSKKENIELRGNALKLYYANKNKFLDNTIEYSKDVTLNYSNNNLFQNNKFIQNRFATHLSLSNNNIFKNNFYQYNSVAIMLMGAKNTKILNNQILSSTGAAGIGVMIEGVENFQFHHNIVKFNAKGLYINSKERSKGMKRYITYNEISYNSEAIHFHSSIKENTITHNRIFSNIEDITKDLSGKFSSSNIVAYNYWDRYEGFDKNHDNIGDSAHKIYIYSDTLWQYNNKVKFFYASPIMTLLNFLSHLAPFIEPSLIFEDTKPIFYDSTL